MDRDNAVLKIMIHWMFAIFILGMLSIGFYMKNTEYSLPTFELHKSLGVIFFGLVFIRIYTTIKYPWRSLAIGSGKEKVVHAAHLALLALMVLMPVTGLLSSGFSGYSVHLFDFVIVPKNVDGMGNNVPFNATVYGFSKMLHWVFAYALAALICLHVLAALKHHFIDKDATLVRMLLGRGFRK